MLLPEAVTHMINSVEWVIFVQWLRQGISSNYPVIFVFQFGHFAVPSAFLPEVALCGWLDVQIQELM